MTAHIIGLGKSAEGWGTKTSGDDGTGSEISIGVNDAEKWGYHCQYLAIFNHPSKFKNEPDRMKTMLTSRPEKVFTHAAPWRNHFKNVEILRLTEYNNRLRKGVYYHKNTSPMIAMSIAWNMGATEIVLWGVDMMDHKTYRPGNRGYDREVKAYLSFIEHLEKYGVKTFVGAEGSVFCNHLQIWKSN